MRRVLQVLPCDYDYSALLEEMLQQHVPRLHNIPVAARESWSLRLCSVLRGLYLYPSLFTLFKFFAFPRCTLYFGRRGGRRHVRDLAHEIERRLTLWDVDDVPTLWQEALASQAIRAVRRSAWLIGNQLPESVARRVELLVVRC